MANLFATVVVVSKVSECLIYQLQGYLNLEAV